jgi:hypothetical protein
MEDNVPFSFPLGLDQFLTPSRKKMKDVSPIINIGDIVTPLSYFKNGKPMTPQKYNYNEAPNIGVVVREFIHPNLNQACYEVRWSIKSSIDIERSSYYIKENSNCYLVKLS